MKVVLDRSDEVVKWALTHMPGMFGRPFEQSARAIGVEGDAGLMGAVIFHQWQPDYGTIQASTAASDPRWLRCRALYDAIFRYAFVTCGVRKIWAATPRSNARALRMLKAFGMQPEAILHRHFGLNEDAVISRKFVWEWDSEQARPAEAA